jgi:hypothetical protein
VEAEQDSSIRIDDLPKVVMGGKCLRLTEQSLIPFEAVRHIAYPDDRPRALHEILLRPNENKISDGYRERAPIEVEGS